MDRQATSTAGYQPFVDGLRAFAILAVVAYHAGLPVPGGFVGVDVFFVISGHLIIGQIRQGIARGNFSLKMFWARRVLRILPSYLIVIGATAAVAPFILVFPDEMADFGQQVAYSAIMVVNHYFLAQQGYFDTAADLKPLLHLWSLAVEEQFYLVAPLAMLGLSLVARWRPLLVGLLFAASLLGCILLTSAFEQNYAFYLMPLRAWEFIAGGAIGVVAPLTLRLPRWLREGLAVLALAGLIATAFLYDSGDSYPSYLALLPVLTTTLVIALGTAAPDLLTARLLALRPLTWIGLVSYAWYLWHWPLLAFATNYAFGELPVRWGVVMALLSLLLAIATYVLVERPIKLWRIRTHIDRRWSVSFGGLGAMVPYVALGMALTFIVAPQIAAGIPQSMRPPVQGSAGVCALDRVDDTARCHAQVGDLPTGLLVGDSHARGFYEALQPHARRSGAEILTISPGACSPILGTRPLSRSGKPTSSGDSCVRNRTAGFAALDEFSPSFAVIFARWVPFTPWKGKTAGGTRRPLGEIDRPGLPDDPKAFFVEKFRATIDSFRARGIERILVIGPVPELYRPGPPCVIRAERYGIDLDRTCSVKLSDVKKRQTPAIDWLRASVEGLADVRLVDPKSALCDDTWCRPFLPDAPEIVLYRDSHHLGRAGTDLIYEALQPELDWVMGGK